MNEMHPTAQPRPGRAGLYRVVWTPPPGADGPMPPASSASLLKELYACKLANAVMRMAERCGRSERKSAHAFNWNLRNYIEGPAEKTAAAQAQRDRYERATTRQYRALQRLVDALRDLSGGAA